MGISNDSEFADVLEDSYLMGSLTVGTLGIEAKVGASRLVKREKLFIYNAGPRIIYLGTSSVTTSNGLPIFKRQHIIIPIGEHLPIFLRTATGSSTAIIHEVG